MNYYNEIKNKLIDNEVYKRVKDYYKNRNDLSTYYEVGKLLFEAGGHYGKRIIKEYSIRLTDELDIKYSERTLYKMMKYYTYIYNQKVPTVSAKLSWSHYDELLSIKNVNEINYYISIIESYNLSVRELRERIKNKEYQRLDDNTKLKLINKEEVNVSDFIKNPIVIKNKYNYDIENISEKMLQALILEDIPSFLEELGEGYSFIKNEYKIKMGNTYNYIDLLLFNYVYNCFVVIELKVCELKKEHIGQIEVYMNYIDKHIKSINQDKTIGIIITRRDNHYYIEYSSDNRIYTRDYVIS